jgi:hypothetical protein
MPVLKKKHLLTMACSTTQIVLGVMAALLIFAIIGTCAAPSRASKPPVRLTKEKAPVELAQIPEGSKHDNFFSNGLGYMANMKTPEIEDQYKSFMSRSTGGGYHFMNPAQIAAEIGRITDDRITVGTEIQKKERPSFKRGVGYINGAVDEANVKSVSKLNRD